MKKLLVLFLVSLLALTACSKKEEGAADAKANADAEAAPVAENDPFEGMERTPMAFRALLKDKSQDEQEALRLQAAKHSDPKMRLIAYDGAIKYKPESKDKALAYIEILKGEKDSEVLQKGLEALKSNLPLDKAVVDFYREAAKHEEADVRIAAAAGLLNNWNLREGMVYTVDEAIALLDDKDVEVRKEICENLGRAFGDAKLVPVYEKAIMGTEGAPVDSDLQASCVQGLSYLWYNSSVHVPEAYDLTVRYFEHTPRTKDWPSHSAMFMLSLPQTDIWKKNVADFDGKRILDAMKSVVKDDLADDQARAQAVKVVGVFGTKADVEELKSVENGTVRTSVIQTLEKMK